MRFLLVDLSSVFFPVWHMSGQEADQDHASRATVARIHQAAIGYDGVAICCDSPRSVRKEMDPTYKANRPPHEAPLLHQLKLAQEQLGADGFPVWQVDGYEADDIIASVAASNLVATAIDILSADKDLLSLVDEIITVVSPATGKRMGPEETAEKFVPPHQMRDYLILVGDASDNIKGVPGIGDKKAKALLAECGSIIGIYDRIRSGKCIDAPFTPSIVTALKESLQVCEMGRKLVQLKDDLPIPFDEILRPRTGEPMETAQEPEVYKMAREHEQAESTNVTQPPKSDRPPAQIINAEPAPQMSVALATVEWSRELEPRSLAQAERVAKHMFASRLFAAYGTQEAVLSTILAGRELGVGAMASLRGFHIIEGKPAMSAGLMAALIIQSGKAKYFEPSFISDTKATYRTWRVGSDREHEASFTIEQARMQELIKPKSGWSKTPEDMLVARAIARLARRIYPDVCFGLYTPEELGREDLERQLEAA